MSQAATRQPRPWIGDPPRSEPPEIPGYALLRHERVDMLQLSIAGVVLLPLWWFVFAGIGLWLSGEDGFSVSFGLFEVVFGVVVALVIVPVVHELFHGLTARMLGAQPAYGVGPGYAYTTFHEPMGRYAYLTVGLVPFVLFSVLGVVLAAIFPALRGWLMFACIINAAGAIGDLWMAWRILRLPRRAIFCDLADGFAAYVPQAEASPQPAAE